MYRGSKKQCNEANPVWRLLKMWHNFFNSVFKLLTTLPAYTCQKPEIIADGTLGTISGISWFLVPHMQRCIKDCLGPYLTWKFKSYSLAFRSSLCSLIEPGNVARFQTGKQGLLGTIPIKQLQVYSPCSIFIEKHGKSRKCLWLPRLYFYTRQLTYR